MYRFGETASDSENDFSKIIAHIFSTEPDFKNSSPEAVAAERRAFDHQKARNHIANAVSPSLNELLAPPKNFGKIFTENLINTQGPGRGCIAIGNNWWVLYLQVFSPSDMKKRRYPSWTLSCNVGKKWRHNAALIRLEIIEAYGESVYQEWKSLVLEDVDTRRSILNTACDLLQELQTAAFSYVSSPSSARLLSSHNIPMCRDHAFLFPQLKGGF